MFRNVFYWVRNNFGKFCMGLCTVVSVIVTVMTYHDQQKFKSSYNTSAQKIIMNSEDIELSDVDIMFASTYHSDDLDMIILNLDNQLGQMKENYKIIAQLKAVNFPNKQALNYQILRINMKSDIDVIDQFLLHLKSESDSKDEISNSDKITILTLLAQVRQENRRSYEIVQKNRQLKSSSFKKSDVSFEKAYGSTTIDLLKKVKKYDVH